MLSCKIIIRFVCRLHFQGPSSFTLKKLNANESIRANVAVMGGVLSFRRMKAQRGMLRRNVHVSNV